MSASAPAARMSSLPLPLIIRIGRRRLVVNWRPPRRVAGLLVCLLARWAAVAMLPLASLATTTATAAPPAANALPTGGVLASGQATISQAGSRMDIVQQTGKAILNWNTFDIGSGASVNFRQPDANASILNRVATNAPSQLLGSLTGNGKVWLINPAGIMVGAGAKIDLHGFVASTLAVRDEDFLAGRLRFGSAAGNVGDAAAGLLRNDGAISTPTGGSVYLVGQDVENRGLVRAPGGEVLLAAGASVELLDTATPGVKVAITGGQGGGQGGRGGVTNLGQILSTAGRIGMAGVLVKNSGVLNASGVVSDGGRIFLRASKDAIADGASAILATGGNGAVGGVLEMTGRRVGVLDTATLDASGPAGGGTVLVGGEFQGGPGLPRARSATFAPGATMRADALYAGDGGKVVLWSDGATLAAGSISARGGALGGNGGQVETSGKQHLAMAGLRADTSAPRGASGTLLLDPASLVIGATANLDGVAGHDAGDIVFDPTTGLVELTAETDPAVASQITAASVGTLLGSNNVTLAAVGDVTVSSAIEKTTGADKTLTLTAGGALYLNQSITSTSGKLNLNLNAGGIINSNGVGNVSLNAGVLTANAGNNISLLNITAASVTANSTIGSVSAGGIGLLTFSGSAGGTINVGGDNNVVLSNLTTIGPIGISTGANVAIFSGGTISAGGDGINVLGAVQVTGDTTVSSAGAISFDSPIYGATGVTPSLTINNGGLLTLGGTVGVVPLGALTVSGASLVKAGVTTSGAQTWTGQLNLANSATLKGSGVTLNGGAASGASGGGVAPTLTVESNSTALAGAFTGLTGITNSGALGTSGMSLSIPLTNSGTLALASGATATVSGGLAQSGAVTLGEGATLEVGGATVAVFSGGISGGGQVTFSGSGASVYSAPTTYTGLTSITSSGRLVLGVQNALSGGGLTIGAGGLVTLNANSSIAGQLTNAGTLGGSGTLTAAGGYQLTGGTINANLGAGTLTQASGATTLNGAHGGSSVSITGGSLTLGAAARLADTATVTITPDGSLAIATGGETIATLANAGKVNVSGPLTLANGASTNLSGGTLNLNGSLGQVVVGGTATLANASGAQVVLAGTHATPITGAFSNAGTLSKGVAGTQAVALTANTGTLSVVGGTLSLAGLASNAGTISVASGATLSTASGALANGTGGVLSGDGIIAANVTNSGTLAPGGTGGIGALNITGTLDTSSGTVNSELTSTASYDKVLVSGAVTIGTGSVINRTDITGAYVSGEQFDVIQSASAVLTGSVPDVSGFGVNTVSPSYHALRLTSQAGDNFWIRGAGAGVYQSGAWEDAANWQLGLPTAAQLVHIARPDVLTVTLNGSSGPASIKGLDLGPANTLALTGTAALTLGIRESTLAGKIQLASGATLARAGVDGLILASGGELGGAGTVNVGAGTFTNNGKVFPGGAGTIGALHVTGNYAQGAGGALLADLGGYAAGQSDVLVVTGTAALNGRLTLALADAYASTANRPITLVSAAGGRTGTLLAVAGLASYQAGYSLADGEAVRVNYLPGAPAYFNNAANTMLWNDAGNWSSGHTPTAGETVAIDSSRPLGYGGGANTLAALNLNPGAVLEVGTGTLTVTGGANVDGTLRLTGDAAIMTVGNMAGTGQLTVNAGRIGIAGTTPAVGALTLGGGQATISTGTLTVGSFTQTAGLVNGGGSAGLTVSSTFAQSGGSISGGMGVLDITQAAGNLTLGNITADTLKATATGGAIGQGAGTALALQALQLSASGAVSLTENNAITGVQGSAGGALSVYGLGAVSGALAAGGDIALNSGAGPLAINANVVTTGGNVTLLADEVDVYNTSLVQSASGAGNKVSVTSSTASLPIKLSSLTTEDTGTGLLLNKRDMAAFSTPTLVLGDAAHTGAISLTDGGVMTAPGVTGTVKFINNGDFARSSTESFTLSGLDITAKNGIVLSDGNQVKAFAALNSGTGNITFVNNSGADNLVLGTVSNPVGGVVIENTGGLSLPGPGAVTASGTVSLIAHSPIYVNSAITSGAGISLNASTSITVGAAGRLTNTTAGPITMLAQNGALVIDSAAAVNSGGGAISLSAQGAGGTVVAAGSVFTGAAPTISSTALDVAAAEAAAEEAARAAAEAAAAKAAADAAAKAAADAAAEAAANAAAKAAADAAAKAAADAAAKAAADAATKAASDAAAKAAAEAAAKKAAEEAAAKAAAEAASQKAAEEAATKAAAEAAAKKAAEEAASKAAAEAASKKAAEEAAAKAAAEAATKAAAQKAAEEAAAKAAVDAAAEAAAKAASEAAAKAASDAAAKAAAEAAAAKAATDAAAKAAAEVAAQAAEAASRAAAQAAAEAAARAAAQEAARLAAQDAARTATNATNNTASSTGGASASTSAESRPNEPKPGEAQSANQKPADAPGGTLPAASQPAIKLAQVFDQQTIGGGSDSFGGGTGSTGSTGSAATGSADGGAAQSGSGDGKKDEKAEKGDEKKDGKKGEQGSGDGGKGKGKKVAVCK